MKSFLFNGKKVFYGFPRNDKTRDGGNEGYASRYGPGATAGIISRKSGNVRQFPGIQHLELPDPPFFQLLSHDAGQWADARLPDIRNFEACRIQLVAGSHGGNNRDAAPAGFLDEKQFRGNGVDAVDNIGIAGKIEKGRSFLSIKALPDVNVGGRIDIENPVPHHLDLRFSQRRMERDKLTIQVGRANSVVVNQQKMAYSGAGKTFGDKGTNPADAEKRYPFFGQDSGRVFPEQQLASYKLVLGRIHSTQYTDGKRSVNQPELDNGGFE